MSDEKPPPAVSSSNPLMLAAGRAKDSVASIFKEVRRLHGHFAATAAVLHSSAQPKSVARGSYTRFLRQLKVGSFDCRGSHGASLRIGRRSQGRQTLQR